GQLDEAVSVTYRETNLNLSTNSEHITLPQVQRSATIIQGRLVRDRDANALNKAPRSRTPVASNTNNVSSSIRSIVRLEYWTCKDGTDSALILNILYQQRATGVVRNTERINFRRLRECPRGNVRIIGRATNNTQGVQVVSVSTSQLNRRSIRQSVKTSTRGSLKTKRGAVKLLSECLWQLLLNRRIQRRKVTTELIGERNNHRKGVALQVLIAEGRARNWLLVSFRNPLSLRIAGNDRNIDTAARQLHTWRQRLNNRKVLGFLPNSLGKSLGKFEHASGAAIYINSHY